MLKYMKPDSKLFSVFFSEMSCEKICLKTSGATESCIPDVKDPSSV